jgi:hypothetical protein
MKSILCFILLVVSIEVNAQKVVENTIDAKNITTVIIEGDDMFNIKLTSKPVEMIALKTKSEGEYSEDVVVLSSIKQDSLIISSAFQPLYVNHNDKLSAHKVLSIEAELIVPKDCNIYLKSKSANVEVIGSYKTLILELSQGNCDLKSFAGNAIINTVEGQIILNTNYARVEAYTKTGTITREEITLGNNEIKLNSVNGNISITNTKK